MKPNYGDLYPQYVIINAQLPNYKAESNRHGY